jgi:hypothetical protein
MPDRFDVGELDPEDPFEVDEGNRAHLHKHVANDAGRQIVIGPDDLLDVFLFGEPIFYPADQSKGDAEWIMIGEVPGVLLTIPLARARPGNTAKCRPIGIYQASENERRRYREDFYD